MLSPLAKAPQNAMYGPAATATSRSSKSWTKTAPSRNGKAASSPSSTPTSARKHGKPIVNRHWDDDKRFLFSLTQRDTVELDVDMGDGETRQELYLVKGVSFSSGGRIEFMHILDARRKSDVPRSATQEERIRDSDRASRWIPPENELPQGDHISHRRDSLRQRLGMERIIDIANEGARLRRARQATRHHARRRGARDHRAPRRGGRPCPLQPRRRDHPARPRGHRPGQWRRHRVR